jgi:hypothetical protein
VDPRAHPEISGFVVRDLAAARVQQGLRMRMPCYVWARDRYARPLRTAQVADLGASTGVFRIELHRLLEVSGASEIASASPERKSKAATATIELPHP